MLKMLPRKSLMSVAYSLNNNPPKSWSVFPLAAYVNDWHKRYTWLMQGALESYKELLK